MVNAILTPATACTPNVSEISMRLLLAAALFPALAASVASAQTAPPGVAIGATAGTSGLGAEVQVRLGPIFTLRGAVDRLTHDFDETYDGVDYEGDLAFDTLGGFVDLHPFANALLISGGAYVGDRNVRISATPSGPVEIGGQTYSPSQVGTLDGEIKLTNLAPFVGIGWDDTFTRQGRWGFRAIAGVAASDKPEVALKSSGGSLSNDAAFQARLNDEAKRISEDTDGYALFPVIQVGLNYKF